MLRLLTMLVLLTLLAACTPRPRINSASLTPNQPAKPVKVDYPPGHDLNPDNDADKVDYQRIEQKNNLYFQSINRHKAMQQQAAKERSSRRVPTRGAYVDTNFGQEQQ